MLDGDGVSFIFVIFAPTLAALAMDIDVNVFNGCIANLKSHSVYHCLNYDFSYCSLGSSVISWNTERWKTMVLHTRRV